MRHKKATVISVLCAAILGFVLPQGSRSESADPPPPPSLKTLPVPEPPNLSEFVRDRQLAIVLGKALFWDMQVGSDGIVACATCHFHAGADSRSINQLNPGLNRVTDQTCTPNPDRTIAKGANAQLTAADFPFHKLADPTARTSAVLSDTNDVASSQGVTNARFVNATAGSATDVTVPVPDGDGFQVGGVNVRRVQPRNTPSVINAVFNHRNFWDGRAQNVFNGVNHLGDRDPNARVYRASGLYDLSEVQVRIPNASLASQAVAPPVNRSEQSAAGRDFSDIAERFSFQFQAGSRRTLSLRPLGKQLVAKDDSVLGPYSRYPQQGLNFSSYEEMIAVAFQPDWWRSARYIHVNDDGSRSIQPILGLPGENDFLQIQYNFSLFFGLAVQMYEATLVANDTPFDRFMEGKSNALTALQKQGLGIFLSQTRGRCINCHTGPEFTEASYSVAGAHVTRRREDQMIDTGFFNIGVRPTYEDLGIGGDDGTNSNQPLSYARLSRRGLFVDPNLSPPLSSDDVLALDGAFKVPSLRNVELTAPYFHNGGQGTLSGVIDFYSRGGGDFFPIDGRDGTITPVRILNLDPSEKSALLAFLLALTDDRVRRQQAPFDHPQIFVPNGAMGNTVSVQTDGKGQAVDRMLEVPAVGKKGGAPPKNFLE